VATVQTSLLRLTLLYAARPEPFDSPLTLSLSKGERFAQDVLVEGRARQKGSWFDKLTMSVSSDLALATLAIRFAGNEINVEVQAA
jgi:hypothetical protein